MTRVALPIVLAAIAAVAGCGDSAPDNPTWIDDVRPIVAANCARCHAVPAAGGAPASLRFDKYGDTPAVGEVEMPTGSDAMIISGAAGYAPTIAEEVEEGAMPPDGELTADQIETIERWAETVELGERAGNADPELVSIDDLPASASGDVSLAYVITDADGDLVDGTLVLRPRGAGDGVVVAIGLHDGTGDARFDAATAGPGSYDAVLVLTDDLARVEQSLGEISIAP